MHLVFLGLLLAEGFVLLGFEILSSRYLHPYFGSGIDTWASIISTVLLAMMCGYFLGGHAADRARTTDMLAAAAVTASAYLVGVAFYAKDVLHWMIGAFEHGPLPLTASAIMIVFVPVLFLSAWQPFLVRVLLRTREESGRVTGTVYGVSTFGNVIGALATAYWLIPRIGTFAITLLFASILLALAAVLFVLRSRTLRMMHDGAGRP